MIALQRQRLQEKTSRTFSDVLWGCSQKVRRPGWQEPGLALAKARRANLIFTSMYCQKYKKNRDSRKQITPHSLRAKSETSSALVTKGREHREKSLHPNCCAHNRGDSLADFTTVKVTLGQSKTRRGPSSQHLMAQGRICRGKAA